MSAAKRRPAEGLSEPLGRRERNKLEKRDRVRAAAWELFRTHGFEGTTTRAIAARANIAAGTLFLYAEDKTDLLFLVFEHRLRECVDAGFRTLDADAPLVDQLLHLFGGAFAMYEEAPDVGRRFIKELPGATGSNAARVHQLTFDFLARVSGLCDAARARGRIRPEVASLLVAQSAFALYFAALLGWLSGTFTKDYALGVVLRESLALLEGGFGTTG